MKQTLFTALLLVASLGMASAADEKQETISFKNVMPSLINDSGSSAISFVTKDGKVSTGWQDWPKEPGRYSPAGFPSTTVFATDAKILGLEEEGWKFFMGNASNNNQTDVRDVSSNGFTFLGRYGYAGEAVTSTTSVARLLKANDASNLTSFTVNFAVNHTTSEEGTAPNIYVGLWSYNASRNEANLLTYTSYNAHTDTSAKILTAGGLNLGADDVIIVSWFNQSGAKDNVVSGVSFSAEGTGNSSVPEPATAALSLLVLAGLAARRRR